MLAALRAAMDREGLQVLSDLRLSARSASAVAAEPGLGYELAGGSAFAGCFLAETGVDPLRALKFAVEYINAPGAALAALGARSGIQRRQTLRRLLALIREADEAKRDWLLQGIRRYLGRYESEKKAMTRSLQKGD